jgi:hypothetical protein
MRILALALGTLVPTIAAADPPSHTSIIVVYPQPAPPPPPQSEVTTEADLWNAPTFAIGAGVFLGSYGASTIVAATDDHDGASHLYIPLVGPWLALGDWGGTATLDKAGLIADGLAQAGGVVAMIDALLEPTHHRKVRASRESFRITPKHNGIAFWGRF